MYTYLVLLGALHESTGNHEAGFYSAGAMILISGILVLFINGIRHLSEKGVTQDSYSKASYKYYNQH